MSSFVSRLFPARYDTFHDYYNIYILICQLSHVNRLLVLPSVSDLDSALSLALLLVSDLVLAQEPPNQ